MARVHLRRVTIDNFGECIRLAVGEAQEDLVASNTKSLAEASVNPNLFPLAIYDAAVAGFEEPHLPMLGFTMSEVTAGVGFILRLMIYGKYQRQGYGRAAMVEVIRRLVLHPEVELIATSHRRGNQAAAQLYRGLGFVDWDIEWAKENKEEVFLRLEEGA